MLAQLALRRAPRQLTARAPGSVRYCVRSHQGQASYKSQQRKLASSLRQAFLFSSCGLLCGGLLCWIRSSVAASPSENQPLNLRIAANNTSCLRDWRLNQITSRGSNESRK
jgi:hypothetical protein